MLSELFFKFEKRQNYLHLIILIKIFRTSSAHFLINVLNIVNVMIGQSITNSYEYHVFIVFNHCLTMAKQHVEYL